MGAEKQKPLELWYGLKCDGSEVVITHEKLMEWAWRHDVQFQIGWGTSFVMANGTRLARTQEGALSQNWFDIAQAFEGLEPPPKLQAHEIVEVNLSRLDLEMLCRAAIRVHAQSPVTPENAEAQAGVLATVHTVLRGLEPEARTELETACEAELKRWRPDLAKDERL